MTKEIIQMICDSHVHTAFSYDSKADMEDVILSAKKNKVSILTFTEHMDMDPPIELATNPSYGFSLLDVNAYRDRFLELKEKHEDKDFKMLWGIEIGLQPQLQKPHQDLIQAYPWDYIIGSAHTINGHDPYFPSYFEGLTSRKGIITYFEAILENLTLLDDVDTLGHIDYIVRYLPEVYTLPIEEKAATLKKVYHPKDYEEIIRAILSILIKKDICLEVNTQSLRRGFGITNPHPDILPIYREMNGKLITLGSDAHFAKDVGADIKDTLSKLKALGFREYLYFEKRKPQTVPIL